MVVLLPRRVVSEVAARDVVAVGDRRRLSRHPALRDGLEAG